MKSLSALSVATLFAACADGAPMGPDSRSASSRELAVAEADGRLPDLGSCGNLAAPEGSTVSFKVFGKGVQIYRWSGTAWVFVNPEARLYADARGNGLVGTHFGGATGLPNWLTNSGSRVEGTVAENGRCTPNADAIPWVKLNAVASGTGVFEHTTLIQRLNTVGGKAPTAAGSVVGEEARVPYTADYLFYRTP